MDAVFEGLDPVPGVKKPDPILVVDQIERAFGGLVAVSVEHLEIQRGAITALIGPNGAGKTTLFNLLTGFDQPSAGVVVFDGRPIGRANPALLARRGMVRTFQLTKALSKMTVLDNMRLGQANQRGERLNFAPFRWLWRAEEDAAADRSSGLLDRFKLGQKSPDFAGTLSGGQRKLLEMARSLMTDPKLVMLDEPMAGVNPALKQSLLDHILELKQQGLTVVFVEHDMDMVREIADWVVVMAEGRVIAEGKADEIGANQQVIDAYLGSHHNQAFDTSSGTGEVTSG